MRIQTMIQIQGFDDSSFFSEVLFYKIYNGTLPSGVSQRNEDPFLSASSRESRQKFKIYGTS
jgi:hypothetical protein